MGLTLLYLAILLYPKKDSAYNKVLASNKNQQCVGLVVPLGLALVVLVEVLLLVELEGPGSARVDEASTGGAPEFRSNVCAHTFKSS